MFLLFIVFGFVSLQDSKRFLVKAKSESSLKSEIVRWCAENLSAEGIDSLLASGEEALETLPDEEKYYRRTEKIKAMIVDKFMNLDEAFVDDFVDDYYQELYEDNVTHSR